MTQAFNLSQFANKVNTSGQASLTTAVTGTLPVANGGTGITSAGSNGNVLTSNGTAWVSSAPPAGGVTSLNGQTGAITDTNLYAIGSYVLGRPNNITSYGVNTTIAGSSLYATTTYTGYSTGFGGFYADVTTAGGTDQTAFVNTGTWRSVSPAGTVNKTGVWGISGLWVRIS
jgi:hypothetical protein